jgi:hypothetical protein
VKTAGSGSGRDTWQKADLFLGKIVSNFNFFKVLALHDTSRDQRNCPWNENTWHYIVVWSNRAVRVEKNTNWEL